MSEETRTLGDMNAEDFFSGIGEAVKAGLAEAGAGRAAGDPVATRTDDDGDDGKDSRRFYGESARVHFAFERDPEIRAITTQEARDARVHEYLECHDWAVAMSERNFERANKIAAASMGLNDSQMRQMVTTGGGAALVPTILEGPIIEKRTLADKITPRAMPHRSESGVLDLAAEGTIVVASGTAEAAPIVPQDLTYDPINLILKKSTAIIHTSREMVFDAAASMQMVRNFSRQAGRAFGDYNNAQNITGDGVGTNYSKGILPNADPVTGTLGSLSRGTFLALMFGNGTAGQGMSAPFRRGSVWLMSSNVIRLTSLLEGSSGQILYPNVIPNQTVPGPVSGDPNSPGSGIVEGLEVIEIEDVGDVLVLANLDFYHALLDTGSLRVETTTEGGSNFENDTQMWKFVQRQDGSTSLDTAAFKKTDGDVTA